MRARGIGAAASSARHTVTQVGVHAKTIKYHSPYCTTASSDTDKRLYFIWPR